MKEIKFNANGGNIVVSLLFDGVLMAGYSLRLYPDLISNDPILKFSGNNADDKPDYCVLPLPVIQNDGRLIKIKSGFKAVPGYENTPFTITVAFIQDNITIGFEPKNGQLDGSDQNVDFSIKLLKG